MGTLDNFFNRNQKSKQDEDSAQGISFATERTLGEEELDDAFYTSRNEEVRQNVSAVQQARTSARATTPMGDVMTKVKVMKPAAYGDVFKIADALMQGYIVSLTLEYVETEEATSIMTFLAGVAYSIDYEIAQVSGNVFTIARKGLLDKEQGEE